jgi:hypothetical protein
MSRQACAWLNCMAAASADASTINQRAACQAAWNAHHPDQEGGPRTLSPATSAVTAASSSAHLTRHRCSR